MICSDAAVVYQLTQTLTSDAINVILFYLCPIFRPVTPSVTYLLRNKRLINLIGCFLSQSCLLLLPSAGDSPVGAL